MLAICMPAAPGCARERAKPKPVSLTGGWRSAVEERAGDMHGRMRENGAPAADQGVGEGLMQNDGLAGFSVGGEPQER